jgi:hypothetical protein
MFTSAKSDEISARLEPTGKFVKAEVVRQGSANTPSTSSIRRAAKYVSHLLVTDDERDLAAFLCGELGAKLLLEDVATGGEPNVADDPLSALPSALPSPAIFGSKDVHSLIFWLAGVGPIKTLGNAPPATDPRDRVARRLTQDAAGARFADVIDLERTPVLTLTRSHWHAQNRLAPGNLGATTLRTMPTAKRLYCRALRWLKKRGVKLDPFAHCEEVRDRRPQRLGPLWVWAQPNAKTLVDEGIEIWPWNA